MNNLLLIWLLLVVIFGYTQQKKWMLKEYVNYALENNITTKESNLDLV